MKEIRKMFLFFFFLFGVSIFLFPETSKASVCSFRTRNPNTAQVYPNPAYAQYQSLASGQGVPFCQDIPNAGSCANLCGDQRTVIDCTFHAGINSCEEFSNQFIQKETPLQTAREAEFAQEQERRKVENTEATGTCLCRIDDQTAPLTTLDGKTPQNCVDRNPSINDGSNEPTGEALYNCQWVSKGDVENITREDQNRLNALNDKLGREKNPLEDYKSKVKDLNKLKANSIQGFLGVAIKTATGIMGTIALIMMIYGGFLWLTSMGNSSQVEKAQNVIFWGALGIFVIFGSYALITFIFEAANPALTN